VTALVTLGWSALSWIEHYLVHGPGDVQGQRIQMDDEFAAFVLKAYNLDPTTGARLVRRAFLSRAKGRAKSEIAGWVATFEALGPCRFDHWAGPGEVSAWGYEYEPGEPVGRPLPYVEVLCVATEEGQAGNTYDVIHYNLDPETCSPELAADFPGLDIGLTRIVLPEHRGLISPETAGDSSKDGGKSTFIVADETHLWLLKRLQSMHATMARNLLKRKLASGWMLETSTMYGEGEGSVAEGTHAYAMGKRAKALLFDHRQASAHWDLDDRPQRIQALREAYGPAADWMDLEAIADSWDDPQVTASAFRRYFLNQPAPMAEKPTSILPAWAACASPERALPGVPVLALATSLDRMFSCVAGAIEENGTVLVRVLRHGPHGAWVVDECKALSERFNGAGVAVDRKGPAGSSVDALEAAGVRVQSVTADDVCDAAALVLDRTTDRTLEHFNQAELNAAVDVAAWRSVGERRAFGRRLSGGDISALEAASLAALLAQPRPGEGAAFNIW